MTEKTVHLHISIEISTDEDCDTGYTVAEWNATSDEERSRISSQLWDECAANADGGGMSVTTAGAEPV